MADDDTLTGEGAGANPDENAGAATTTTTDGEGAKGDDPAGTTTTPNDGDDDPADWDKDRAARTIRAQRESEQKLQKQLKELQSKVDEHERAGQTELEQAKGDLEKRDQAIAKLNERIQSLTVDAKLTGAGIPEARLPAARALASIEFDDEGTPTNLADAIESLKTEHGYLFEGGTGTKPARQEGSSNAGAGSRKGDSSDVVLSAEERDIASRAGMTPDEYIKWNSPRN